MIINIPLQINEESMEEVIRRDYEEKILNKITEYIRTALVRRSGLTYGEVVHCEDCYHWNKDTHNCEVWHVTRVADDFCSEGIWRDKAEALIDNLKKMGDNMK